MVVHFFSGRPSGLRTQINKDSTSLGFFILFSKQFSNYRWIRQPGTITSMWTSMMKGLAHHLM
jgi:hypothetical protein